MIHWSPYCPRFYLFLKTQLGKTNFCCISLRCISLNNHDGHLALVILHIPHSVVISHHRAAGIAYVAGAGGLAIAFGDVFRHSVSIGGVFKTEVWFNAIGSSGNAIYFAICRPFYVFDFFGHIAYQVSYKKSLFEQI